MAKKFSKLRAGMSAEAQAKSKVKAQTMLQDMPLQELRLARGLSQKTLAEVLHVQQPAVAKMEKQGKGKAEQDQKANPGPHDALHKLEIAPTSRRCHQPPHEKQRPDAKRDSCRPVQDRRYRG